MLKNILKSMSYEKNGLAKRLRDSLDKTGESVAVVPFGVNKMVISDHGPYNCEVRLYGSQGELDCSYGWWSVELCWLYANTVAKSVNLSDEHILFDHTVLEEVVEELKNHSTDDIQITWEKECDYGGLILGEAEGLNPKW